MANNTYVNKVQYGSTTLIDLTADTVTAGSLLSGYTAHDASGAPITGTAEAGTEAGTVSQDADGYLVLDDDTPPGEPTIEALTVTPTTSQQVFDGTEVSSTLYVQANANPQHSSNLSKTLTVGQQYSVVAQNLDDNGWSIGNPYPAVLYTATESETLLAIGDPSFLYVSYNSVRNSRADNGTSKGVNVKFYEVSTVDGYLPVTVNAIPNQKSSSDLTVSGATVTAPAGYYASSASKSVSSGTEGTPTATKGTVSNNSVSITPSVTNSAGYISGGTHSGTAVSVSASELVSGTYTVNSSGTKDVTNYASVSVDAGSATAPASISATGASVATGTNTLTLSKTVSMTPSVTDGYVSSGTAGNSSVSLTASVNTRSSSDLTASNLTVTAPSGYYASNATKTLSDQNLSAGNIKKDISIFGVTGVYEGAGPANVVFGEFTASTAGTVQEISVNYSGNGHPVFIAVYPSDGYGNNSTLYTTNHQYAIVQMSAFVYLPSVSSSASAYGSYLYKSQATGTQTSGTRINGPNMFGTQNNPTTSSGCVAIRSSDNFAILVSDTSYGFLSGAAYKYVIVYSS